MSPDLQRLNGYAYLQLRPLPGLRLTGGLSYDDLSFPENADLPPLSDTSWELGQPDLVLQMPEYTPPERSRDTYRCFVLPTGLTDTQYVRAMQALPGSKQEVHHVLVFIDQFRWQRGKLVNQLSNLLGAEHLPRFREMGELARRQFESSLLIELAARMYHLNQPRTATRYVLSSLLIYPFRNRAFFRMIWRSVRRVIRNLLTLSRAP